VNKGYSTDHYSKSQAANKRSDRAASRTGKIKEESEESDDSSSNESDLLPQIKQSGRPKTIQHNVKKSRSLDSSEESHNDAKSIISTRKQKSEI
jgi:hypothetical protein